MEPHHHNEIHSSDEIHTAPRGGRHSASKAVAAIFAIIIIAVGIIFLVKDRHDFEEASTQEITPTQETRSSNIENESPAPTEPSDDDSLSEIESELEVFTAPDVQF